MDLVLVGAVIKAHGLRGEVMVQAHNVASPLWKVGMTLYGVGNDLADEGTDRLEAASLSSYVLRAFRRQIAGGEERLLCTFEGIADRTAAEAMRSVHLAIDGANLPALGDDEFYHHELRGFAVVDGAGLSLGTIVGVFPAPAQDLLEVMPPASKAVPKPETWFIPFVSAIVKTVDRRTRTVTIDPPEGLVP